ncbi:MAG: hypothetical protein LBC94_00305 [Desulfovibrio sp.]|jgi:hypothetical protein|nr:hypothetical protein [Desulfovibrio sp.]
MMRQILAGNGGVQSATLYTMTGAFYPSPYSGGMASGGGVFANTNIDSGRVSPVGSANKPRAWGALACVYLGQPAS